MAIVVDPALDRNGILNDTPTAPLGQLDITRHRLPTFIYNVLRRIAAGRESILASHGDRRIRDHQQQDRQSG